MTGKAASDAAGRAIDDADDGNDADASSTGTDVRGHATAATIGAAAGAATGAVMGGPPGAAAGAATGVARGLVAKKAVDKAREWRGRQDAEATPDDAD